MNRETRLEQALKGLVQWVSDNHAHETWQDEDGEHWSYDDLDEMIEAMGALES